jgi:Holliday junction resolvase
MSGAYGQTDGNQAAIVAALRVAGCSVVSLHAVGAGIPDLLVGRVGLTFLLEVKTVRDDRKKRSPLTPAQIVWHQQWRGQVAIVTTPEEALAAVGLLRLQQL